MAIVDTVLTLPGLRAEFFDRFEAIQTHYGDLSTPIKSNKDKESYGFLGTVPPMREWGTGREARGMFAEKYDVENAKYECTLEVDRDEIDDDQTGQIRVRTRQLADRAATHKDYLLSLLLANGDQAGYLAYDGKPFFAATHESGKSGVQDNTLESIATDADDPTLAEFRTALKLAIAKLFTFKDDQGEPATVNATGLVVVTPPSMFMTALEAVNATVVDSTTNVLSGAARVIAFPRLTDLSKWFLLKTDGAIRPFIFQDRAPLEFTALEEKSDEGFRREKFLYGVRARYAMTYGYWQYALSVDFTAE